MAKCFYCERALFKHPPKGFKQLLRTTDHIIPLALGGSNKNVNKVVACYQCNHLKSNLKMEDFIAKVISKKGDWNDWDRMLVVKNAGVLLKRIDLYKANMIKERKVIKDRSAIISINQINRAIKRDDAELIQKLLNAPQENFHY